MSKQWECRLTVIGPAAEVRAFVNSHWPERLGARYCELVETAPRRFVCQFEVDSKPSPMGNLSAFSRRRPKLVFLLTYEVRGLRTIGLAKASRGTVEAQEFAY